MCPVVVVVHWLPFMDGPTDNLSATNGTPYRNVRMHLETNTKNGHLIEVLTKSISD